MIAPSAILETGRPGDEPVARRHGQPVTFSRLQRDVAALLAALGTESGARWLVHCEDSYAFAVGLLAVWHAGGVAVLPPNDQPETLGALASETAGLLADGPRAFPARVLPVLGHPEVDRPRWPRLPPRRPLLELLTSGSSGVRKRITKTLGQLEAEIAVLEQTFGAKLGDAHVVASVSHQHVYGLLFRVLWPLAAGRPFVAEKTSVLSTPTPQAGMGGATWALVSCPAHLRRLGEMVDIAAWRGRCLLVISSGAPLDATTAQTWSALGAPPLEVFGSTETGGIAWRRQDPREAQPAWTPLQGVNVTLDGSGLLSVNSPFADSSPAGAGLATGDRARLLPDGRFVLLGRADRIAKVAGKRLALPEMEACLEEHPGVDEAAVVTINGPHGDDRTGAVLVLTPAGHAALEARGRRAFHQELREHLLSRFDPVTVPRIWRQVAQLPADANGKTTPAVLRATLVPGDGSHGHGASCADVAWQPTILASADDKHSVEWTLRVSPELPVLAGHFPGDPIVPGVVQLAWIMRAAELLLGSPSAPAGLEAVKFHSLIRPGALLTLRVERLPFGGKLRYSIAAGDVVCASGRIVCGPVAARS